MEPEPIVTVNVRNFRLILPNGRSRFLLQCPVPHEASSHDGKILVRQDQDANNNEVSFKTPAQLVSVDDPPHWTYVHGVFLVSRPGENCREGDAVWLHDAQWKPGSELDPDAIAVVNLRTWKCLTVSLWEVCWVPKYRKLEHADGEEELLTISGRPVRHGVTKKTYVLAIVQRMHTVDDVNPSGDGPCLEIKELVYQELFKYQNLSNQPEGPKRIRELFGRVLREAAHAQATRLGTSKPISRELKAGTSSILATPPTEDDDSPVEDDEDPEFERDAQELIREGMANLARPSRLVVPQICNLQARGCPTPPQLFFATRSTRPSHTNRFPTHHHVLDDSCPSGAAHELHCVYASSHVPDCIIPTTVRHMCCTTGVYPWNKRITRPPAVLPAPSSAAAGGGGGGVVVVVKGGSGVTVIEGGQGTALADLPVDVEMMRFDARRDLDERGRRVFGAGERGDVVDGEWSLAGASLDGVVGDLLLPAAAPVEPAPAPAPVPVPVPVPVPGADDAAPVPLPRARGATPEDVFGERHYYGDDYDDDGDDEDAGADETMGEDGSYQGGSIFLT